MRVPERKHRLVEEVGRLLGIGLALVAAALFVPGNPVLGATRHTVQVRIVAGETPADGGLNFNGFAHGGMTVTVPVGWKVAVEFENASALPHSLEVVPYTSTQSAAPPDKPAFAGAATKNLTTGLPHGARTTVSFVASKPGTYEFVCGVPGHAVAGMWDRLVVSATAKKPSIAPAAAAKVAALTVM